MDIQSSKLELVQMILNIENAEFIEQLMFFVKQEKKDFWDELPSLHKEEIEEGIKQLDKGERVSYKTFMKQYITE